MTTTSHLQILPDFYTTINDCQEAEKSYSYKQRGEISLITNPRYSDFDQVHFTAGDELQFQEYRDMSNNTRYINSTEIDLDKNIFYDIFEEKDIYWDNYKDLEATSVDNTFSYIFNKFKKGIFVKIKDNELKVFLPFSKNNFINEWGNRMKYDPRKYKNMNNFLEIICNQQGYKFNHKRVNQDTNTWYSNNCLVRYEYPLNEGDSGVCNMSDMFKTLCKSRKVPDIEFFINKRDFPLLKKNLTEPYENIFDNDNYPLLSHKYEKYSPILGGSITSEYADISIPTWKDWARISAKEGKYFVKSCNQDDICELPDINWKDKIPTAIFRGASTGCGVNKETNPRLKLAYLSRITPEEDGYKLIDAGITKWNLRPRKIKGQEYLQTINIKNEEPLVNYLSPSEQCKYKYIINVDGHVTAFRISLEMNMGSVILLRESKYNIWFMKYLKAYVHFIPIKNDLSDLIEQIRWCRKNDDKCLKIVENAKIFYKKYLEKEGILDYLQILLLKLKNIIGNYFYNIKDPFQYQIEYEKKMIYSYNYFPITHTELTRSTPPLGINKCPKNERFYSTLKGIEWIFNFIKSNNIDIYNYFNIDNLIPISKTKNTTIYKTFLADYPIIIKISNIITNEIIHEAFISYNCTNKFLKKIPNFEYIFGIFEKESKICICAEYLETELTFDKYINKNYNKYNFINNYINILIQIAFTLDIAQKDCCFVHNDLLPWNILIKEYDIPINIDYIIDNKIFTINTNIVPIIIDYGKSHAIYNGIHYSINNRYKTSTINDLIMLLIKSLKVLTSNELPQEMLKHVLYISNFISNTKFCPKQFNKISDLKMFLNINSQYTHLLISNKYELENYNPIDFIKYMINLNIYNSIDSKNIAQFGINYKSDIGNPKQVFNYILCNNDKDRIKTYLDVFNNIRDDIDRFSSKNKINNNLFLLYSSFQLLDNNLEGNKYLFTNFLRLLGIDFEKSEYMNIYIELDKKLNDKFKLEYDNCYIKQINFKFNAELYQTNEILFEINDLLDPKIIYKKISNIISNEINESKNLINIKDIINSVLYNNSKYRMNKENIEYYSKYFEKFLNINNINMINNHANINTLINITNNIYIDNINFILKYKLNIYQKYIDIYKQILQLNSKIIIILD